MKIYETDKALAEYLLFHFGTAAEISPPPGTDYALHYPERCVSECIDLARVPRGARALDLGCAVGRSTFELAKCCDEVIGIDLSEKFIAAAKQLAIEGFYSYDCVEEGDVKIRLAARLQKTVPRERVKFETGDACNLRADLGTFDIVLMANLIDRLQNPNQCLRQLAPLVNKDGQLVITSPYTWLEEFTPRDEWLGGYMRDGKSVHTLDGLKKILVNDFLLMTTRDLPFLIREHARKFQLSVAQATVWRRL